MTDCQSDGHQTLNSVLHTLSSDTILELEEGEHCVENFTLISDLSNVTISGVNGSVTFITCTHGTGLAFFNVSDLTVEGVTISHCGLDYEDFEVFKETVKQSIDFFFRISNTSDNHIAMACANCSNFTFMNANIVNTSGLGFLGINLIGNSVIENATFTDNVPKGCFYTALDDILQEEKTGGGALIIYHDYTDRQMHSGTCTLNVENAIFINNSYCGIQGVYEIYSHYSEVFSLKHFLLGGGGGLSIILTQIHYSVNATVEDSLFMNNTARYGGGANVEIFTAVLDSHVVFRHCNFTKNGIDTDLVLSADYVTAGSAIGLVSDILQPTFNRSVDIVPDVNNVPCTVVITNSNFIENRAFSGGAILIISLYAPLLGGTLQEEILIESCHFERNYGVTGGAVYAQEWKQSPAQQGLDITFRDVTFDHNTVYSPSEISAVTQNSAVIEILTLNVTFSGDSVIANSDGTGLHSTSSVVRLMDNITFCNNSGSYGGALRLEDGSLLLLSNNTNVLFSNNTGAVFGGALYTSYTTVLPSLSQIPCPLYFGPINLLCFFTVYSECADITEYDITVTFYKNSAPLGSMVYGTTLETCPWARKLRDLYAMNSSLTIFEILDNFTSPFSFDEPPDSALQVATGTGKIVVSESEISAMPGETISVGIQTLDLFNRSVPTLLTTLPSSLARSHSVSTLLDESAYYLLQQSVDPNNQTVEANVTVYGKENVDDVNVTVFSLISFSHSQIAITTTNCSEGFIYEDSSHSCKCSGKIAHSRITCSDKDFTLVVPQDLWIGPGPTDELVISDCHFDYCLGGKRTIRPPNFDEQCQDGYNRSGIVCGKCNEGYSLVFGSNRCKNCSNSHLSMIIVFALLGICLVSAISFLQITISEGYLNGMLFYCNVLNLYLPLLTKSSSRIIHVFFLVSLLNLNLGFESCFYNGMNALARTGLNLVFPLYLFFLMFIIIMIAKRSRRFSDRFTRSGFSAVKVFVTLIVMSYSSLLETCIEILGFDRIETSNGTYYHWRSDANQRYFHGSHIFLGLVAVVLILVLIPLPFLLLFHGKLFKFRIIHRYKPLYDAMWAPFKPNYRFWVGLRLILRGFPFIFVFFFSHPINILFLATFLVSLLWVQGMLKPFRGFARNAFDTFFLSDLLIVSLGALYFYIYLAQFEIIDDSTEDELFHKYQLWFYSIVVGVAYIGFLVIIFWHLSLRFPRLMKLLKHALNQLKRRTLNKSDSKLRSFADGGIRDTHPKYGTISNDGITPSDQEQTSDEDKYGSDNVVHERKSIITYSQLREPLLQSGSLEIETRDNDSDIV